ncbi:hypothetical protein J5N97_023383 [Dioscorea zingiberensis]|uniref:Uncharacterized protein n=1 Tax=Dioscorea zingiberensis TaxID=325984 RepID=A0A9D5CBY6_9LILI|nr:hypothetical protein J5N97_023383 [Dioscorea zingiberensis]
MYSDLFFLAEALLIAHLFLCFFDPIAYELRVGNFCNHGISGWVRCSSGGFPHDNGPSIPQLLHQIGNGNDESSSYLKHGALQQLIKAFLGNDHSMKTKVVGNESPSILICFSLKTNNAGQITSKLHVIELGAQSEALPIDPLSLCFFNPIAEELRLNKDNILLLELLIQVANQRKRLTIRQFAGLLKIVRITATISKHLPPAPDPWPQVVERGFAALVVMAQTWDESSDEFRQHENRCYMKLHDSPLKSGAEEENEMSKLDPLQKRKLRQNWLLLLRSKSKQCIKSEHDQDINHVHLHVLESDSPVAVHGDSQGVNGSTGSDGYLGSVPYGDHKHSLEIHRSILINHVIKQCYQGSQRTQRKQREGRPSNKLLIKCINQIPKDCNLAAVTNDGRWCMKKLRGTKQKELASIVKLK